MDILSISLYAGNVSHLTYLYCQASSVYLWVARDVIISKLKLKSHQSYHPYQAREGVNLYL